MGDLPNPRVKPGSLTLQVDSYHLSHQGRYNELPSRTGSILWLVLCPSTNCIFLICALAYLKGMRYRVEVTILVFLETPIYSSVFFGDGEIINNRKRFLKNKQSTTYTL